MTRCYDEGWLRAYIDDEVPGAEREIFTAHLAHCAVCQQQLVALREQAAYVAALLEEMPSPEPQRACYRLQSRMGRGPAAGQVVSGVDGSLPSRNSNLWRSWMYNAVRSWVSTHRGLAATVAAVCLLLSLLVFPPIRAAADQLLQIFRVRQVLFVPISDERMEQLKGLDFDASTLFVGEPETLDEPTEPYTVTTVAEAESIVGYTLHQPTFTTAPTDTAVVVNDAATMAFQVNVEGARELFTLLAIDDVTLPDALGTTPITVSMPASAALRYAGANYQVMLYQGQSPEMALPEGLDLRELGRAGLRLLGLTPQEAETLSQQVDWSSTLLFPFPADIDNISQITVGDAQGLLTRSYQGEQGVQWQLYWQASERFYVLGAKGRLSRDEVVVLAESVR